MRPLQLCLCLLVSAVDLGAAGCYFPVQLQGRFVTQADGQLSRVNVTPDAIPVWGHCHRRVGDNVILLDESGGASCSRCFRVRLRSRNVLQVLTDGLDKCYTSEAAAENACPGEGSLQILLYKTHDAAGRAASAELCPGAGRYSFTSATCPVPLSELDSCPSGGRLHVRYRRCAFDDYNVTFQCVGQWQGPAEQQFLILLSMSDDGQRPPYRCALFREEAGGNAVVALSRDATCRSAAAGYETLRLAPVRTRAWPPTPCSFPTWAQGRWQDLVVTGSTLHYRDHTALNTYTMSCLSEPTSALPDRFPVFVRTHCEEEMYSCLWIQLRGLNVMEFQLGSKTSTTPNTNLCSKSNFINGTWITQARVDHMQEISCPIAGKYNGLIPDAVGLCAKLSSDCNSPDIMYYTVSDCPPTEILEEREYRCLGQWEEDGLMYTYTQRRDVSTYECFVGTIESTYEIYIKEAGEHCQRDINPSQNGMKLTKIGSCSPKQTKTEEVNKTTSWIFSKPSTKPTELWKPATEAPHLPGKNEASTASISRHKMLTVSLPLFLITKWLWLL